MKKKVIKVTLSEQGIEKAIQELNEYKRWLSEKTKEFLKALADEGVQIASAKFAKAEYDGTNDVSCSVEERGENKVAVVAVGNSVLFIEFGTGIKYPDTHRKLERTVWFVEPTDTDLVSWKKDGGMKENPEATVRLSQKENTLVKSIHTAIPPT